MSEREMRRAAVLAQVKSGAWTLVEGAERMELSYRQAKRLWKRYRSQGARGLVHGSAGRTSNRAQPKTMRTKVVHLIRQKYSGEVGRRFGPTLAAEHLASEDQIALSAASTSVQASLFTCASTAARLISRSLIAVLPNPTSSRGGALRLGDTSNE